MKEYKQIINGVERTFDHESVLTAEYRNGRVFTKTVPFSDRDTLIPIMEKKFSNPNCITCTITDQFVYNEPDFFLHGVRCAGTSHVVVTDVTGRTRDSEGITNF